MSISWQRRQQVPAAEREAFAYHSRRYGTRRLRAEVQADGHAVGASAACSKRTGCAQQPRSFVPRNTASDPTKRAAPNRLLGQRAPTTSNRVWVGDMTYLPRQGGG